MLSARPFVLLQEVSHHTSPAEKKKTSDVTLCLKFAVLPDTSDLTATSRIAPEGDFSPLFKTLILWKSTKVEIQVSY